MSECQVADLTRQLDILAADHSATDPESIEFHASVIFSRRIAPWNGFKRKEEAQKVLRDVLSIAAGAAAPASLIACAVHKASFPGRDPMEIAFREICDWFERFLRTRHTETGVDERGMVVLDDSSSETMLRGVGRDFRRAGFAANGSIYLIEGPHFVESRTSRCVQLADHIAYSVFRYYQSQDNHYLNVILNRFQSDGRVMHGLRHLHSNTATCTCPSCLTVRATGGTLVKV